MVYRSLAALVSLSGVAEPPLSVAPFDSETPLIGILSDHALARIATRLRSKDFEAHSPFQVPLHVDEAVSWSSFPDAESSVIVVPLPTAAWASLFMLGGVMVFVKCIRRR